MPTVTPEPTQRVTNSQNQLRRGAIPRHAVLPSRTSSGKDITVGKSGTFVARGLAYYVAKHT
jgi:hypothetical protein